jgi:hypothetical protein
MTTILVKDEDQGYLFVKRNDEIIAKYPIDKLKELVNRFKDKDMCSSSEFKDYASLNDFINSIDFLEFLEYFLDHLNLLFPVVSPYIKNKTKLTKNELFIMNTISFKKLINFAFSYLYYTENDLRLLYNSIIIELDKIKNTKFKFEKKEKNLLIRLYNGFLYFLELLIERPNDIYPEMTLFTMFKRKLLQGKLNKSRPTFNQSSLTMIYNQFEYKEILEYRKGLLSKFRLFQRKYLSAIAKLRKIGPPSATKKDSLELKKELNKNKNVDYKAYEVFCLYVLSKEENEDIYDFLAGIHKNSNGSVIHKNIKNNTVANIKVNTKKIHHKEYIEKSKEILKSVEDKIKEHGDIIDKKTKYQIERIRKLFDSEQFKNMTLSFGNNNSPSIGGKIIQDCKTIRAINKHIDKMIKEHMNKEHSKKKQEKREEVLKLIDELKEKKTIKNNVNTREKIVHLLGYDLLRKTKKLSKKEINTINLIHNKLNTEYYPKKS